MTEKHMLELFDFARRCNDKCPWLAEQTMESYAREIFKEAKEVELALDNNDHENLKEELGDVLWDLLNTALMAEEEGHFEVKEVIENVLDKMKKRKSFVLEDREVTKEEAERIWIEAKRREKSDGK